MKQMQRDLKALQDSNNEMDVKADMGYKYKDMYTEDYINFLKTLCQKYSIDFNEKEIDWEWCNYIQNKQYELENKINKLIKQSSEYEITNDEIVENMTADEKFAIICRIKNIDIQEMATDIYQIIENYDNYEYKDDYTGICSYEDESMEIEDKYYVNIDDGLLYTKDDWIKDHMDEYEDLAYEEAEQMDWEFYVIEDEFKEEHKEFIKLAIDCKIDRIILKWM